MASLGSLELARALSTHSILLKFAIIYLKQKMNSDIGSNNYVLGILKSRSTQVNIEKSLLFLVCF